MPGKCTDKTGEQDYYVCIELHMYVPGRTTDDAKAIAEMLLRNTRLPVQVNDWHVTLVERHVDDGE